MRLAATLLALLAGAATQAGDGDCRTVPVYSARCFGYQHPSPGCRAIPDAAEPCFIVHGTLTTSNGTPGIRIMRMGNGRTLGVAAAKEIRSR